MKVMRLAAFLALLLFVTACMDNAGQPNTGENQTIDSDYGTEVLSPADPLYKYDPPITVTTVRATDQGQRFIEGESLDQNIWTRIFDDQYGIRVKNVWTVDALQYDQKLNINIASGELPDFFMVNKEEMKRLYQSGQLEDLTEVLNTYGSPYLKQLLQQDQGVSLGAATFEGRLAGIPKMMVNGGVSTAEMLWVRMDWLEKLSLPEPKTIEDVVTIARAFAFEDPDGNGIDDTSGLGVNNELFMYHGSLKGFFNGYEAYPEIWIPDEKGDLVYGSIQQEMKQALSRLAALYQEGLLDEEFAVVPWTKLAQEIADGKLGLTYGTVSDGGYIQRDHVRNEPSADWRAFPIVSVDGSQVQPQLMDAASNFYVVRKGAAHPEAVVKLANIYLRHYYELDYGAESNPFVSAPDGVYPGRYPPVTIDPLDVNLKSYLEVQEALEVGDGSWLGFPASVHYDRLMKYAAGDQEMWFSTAVFGPEGSYGVIHEYDQAGVGIYNVFQGAATPTMAEKLSALLRMQDETFTMIIMGEVPVEEFDRFVEDWRRLGGDQITREVNEWYAAQ